MRKYELFLLIRPDLNDSALNQAIKDFEAYLAKNNGKILDQNNKGKQKTAYAVAGFNEAHQVLLNIEAEPSSLVALAKQIDMDENIIKHLLTTPIEYKEKAK